MLLKGTGPILSSGPFHIVPMQAHHLDALAQLERCCFSTPVSYTHLNRHYTTYFFDWKVL